MAVINLDKDECIGCGVCAQVCPEVFGLDEEAGKANIIKQELLDCVREAADSCPVGCISIAE